MSQLRARSSDFIGSSAQDDASIEFENSRESAMPACRKEAVLRASVTVKTGTRPALPADMLDGAEEGDEFLLRTGEDGTMYLVSRRPRPDVVHQSPVLPPRSAIVPFLRHVPLLASLDSEELLTASAYIVTRQVTRGELVTVEGQPAEAFYVVASGSFKRFKTSRKGREQILGLLGRGDSFGEVSLLDGAGDFASTQALQPGVLYALPRCRYTMLLRESSDFARALNQFLASQVRQVVGLVEDLSFRQVLERVAKLVLAQNVDPSRPHLTQSDMAGIAGTSREVFARALHELERRGVISVSRGRISVRDRTRLGHIAGDYGD